MAAPSSKSLIATPPRTSDHLSKATKILPRPDASRRQAGSIEPASRAAPLGAPDLRAGTIAEPAGRPAAEPLVDEAPQRGGDGRGLARRGGRGLVGLHRVRPGPTPALLCPGSRRVRRSGPDPIRFPRSHPNPSIAPTADRPGERVDLADFRLGAFPDVPEPPRGDPAAKPGDRVVVRGSLLSEAVELSDGDGAPKDLTIEGVNPEGKNPPGPLASPEGPEPGPGLARRLGPRRVPDQRVPLRRSGQGGRAGPALRPGGGLDPGGSSVRRFDPGGVVLQGWAGESSRRATIRRVRFSTSEESEAAILIESDPDRPTVGPRPRSRSLSCRFVGPFQSALLVAGPVDGLEVEQCRFFKGDRRPALQADRASRPAPAPVGEQHVRGPPEAAPFRDHPPSASSDLVVTNNIFSTTPRVAMLDKVSVQPSRVAGSWIWTEEGKKTDDRPARRPPLPQDLRRLDRPRQGHARHQLRRDLHRLAQRGRGLQEPFAALHPARLLDRRRRAAPEGPERPGGARDQPPRPARRQVRHDRRTPRPDHLDRRGSRGRPGQDRRDLEVRRPGPRGLDPPRVRRPVLDFGPPLAPTATSGPGSTRSGTRRSSPSSSRPWSRS